MLFSELVLQGVRQFSKTHRFPLGGGFTAFVGGAGAGKSTFVDVLTHILFPGGQELSTQEFVSKGSDVCRAALTIDDGKGQVYRLVKDLVRGSTALTRFDPASQKFVPVTSTPAEILQYFSSTLHLPQQDVYEGVYVTRPGNLPSSASTNSAVSADGMDDQLGVGMPPGALQGAGDGPAGNFPGYQGDGGGESSFPGYQGGEGSDAGGGVLPDDIDEVRSQIEILTRDLANARMVDDLQFRLDGLQSEQFKLEQKSKGVREAQARVDQCQQAMQGFGQLADLPGDFENRVKSYKNDKEHYHRDLKRVGEERSRWEKKATLSAPGPMRHNRNFLLGMVGGFVALGAGGAGFFMMEGLRWAALADIIFFGIALVAALRHLDLEMGVERAQARLVVLDERQLKTERQFELESSIVRRTMVQVGVEAPEQVLDMYTKRNKALAALAAAEKELASQRAQAGLKESEGRKAEVEAEIDKLDSQLAGLSGMLMSPIDMENQLDALRDKLHMLEQGGSPAAQPAATPFDLSSLGVGAPPGALSGSAGGGLAGPDPFAGLSDAGAGAAAQPGSPSAGGAVCTRLVKLAEDLFLVDLEKMNGMLSPRAGQFLAALSANSLSQVQIGPKGEVSVVDSTSGASCLVNGLTPEQQDQVYLALKLTIIEAFSKQQKVPVFMDDPFSKLPASLHEMVGRLLAGIGRSTQLVLLTSQTELAKHASASFSL